VCLGRGQYEFGGQLEWVSGHLYLYEDSSIGFLWRGTALSDYTRIDKDLS